MPTVKQELPAEIGQALWHNYKDKIKVNEPSFKNGTQWELTSQDWVGYIPLTRQFHFSLQPKVPLISLFGMLEYAYQLKSFHFLKGLMACSSLPEFYEQLAQVLAKRVLGRARQGFYRGYLPQAEELPYLRGRMEISPIHPRPGQVNLYCHYEEQTADIADNQILAWTLYNLARSGWCTERVLPTIRQAYHALHGLVTLTPYQAADCLGRAYHRLNEDYWPLHAMCHFFLEQCGPTLTNGDHAMWPFLVDMHGLYERFVAEWLRQHLPPHLTLKSQERFYLDESGKYYFNIDLVLTDLNTGETRYILDTKYKLPDAGKSADIEQIVAYAVAKNCEQAVLVYPMPLAEPLAVRVGNVSVRSLTFDLTNDLEQAGQNFLWELGVI